MAAPFVCASCKKDYQMPMKVCPNCGFNYARPQRSSGAKARLSNTGCLLFFPVWVVIFVLLRFVPLFNDIMGNVFGKPYITPGAILVGLAGAFILLGLFTQMASIAAHIPESWD